jgi:ribosomal protein S18 acetylase RimI-like enzyme
MNPLHIIEIDLGNSQHRAVVLDLVCQFARAIMGAGQELSNAKQQALIEGLTHHPTTLIFVAYSGEQPVGIAISFLGFSTFAAQKLINIHDFYVVESMRRQGVGRALLQAIETKARELDCCKLTLEVEEHNQQALSLYHRFGFDSGQYDLKAGTVLFRQKKL